MQWSEICPSALNIIGLEDDAPLDVYMQKHAFMRLNERLDCVPKGLIHYNIFDSLALPLVAYDSNGNLLIEYRYNNIRAGYLRADIIDGKVIIRTFLFLTQNTTPEGVQLEKVTGLKKMDKKYLGIDKLSTFINSDIAKNTTISKLIKDAGCQNILDLYNEIHFAIDANDNLMSKDICLDLINYLGLEAIPEIVEGISNS